MSKYFLCERRMGEDSIDHPTAYFHKALRGFISKTFSLQLGEEENDQGIGKLMRMRRERQTQPKQAPRSHKAVLENLAKRNAMLDVFLDFMVLLSVLLLSIHGNSAELKLLLPLSA